MKIYLTDVTFLILIRLDSIERLENILSVTERLIHYFNTNIVVREADSYNNGILKSLLNKKIQYEFIEDKDPVFYRTKYTNQITLSIDTPYIAIWDADIIPDKNAILECLEQLRNKKADVAYPYNGICYDISRTLKNLYREKKDIRLLFRHINKMERLYPHPLVGGAIIMDKHKYIEAGMENEKHYGWGNDDFDRYYRFQALDYKIYRVNIQLFHLSHFRSNNSQFKSFMDSKTSEAICSKIHDSSKEELKNYINRRTI